MVVKRDTGSEVPTVGIRDDEEEFEIDPEAVRNAELSPGRPSRVGICSACDLRRGNPVILCSRVSGERQERGGNLRRETIALASEVASRELWVVDLVEQARPGWTPGLWSEAADLATKRGAALVAWDVTRFARDVLLPLGLPTDDALDWFRIEVGEVGVFTIVDPDADQREIDRRERDRGLGYRRSEVAVELVKQGCAVSLAARIVGVNRRSVQRWLLPTTSAQRHGPATRYRSA